MSEVAPFFREAVGRLQKEGLAASGTVYTLKFRGKLNLINSFNVAFTYYLGGGDYKSIIHLLVQLLGQHGPPVLFTQGARE